MNIEPLDDATLASIRVAQAHRYPQTATLHPPGDRGVGTLAISIVIGNPSGACKMPAGMVTLPAWSQYVLAALSGTVEEDGLVELMARDCILWPYDADEMLATWAAMSQSVVKVLFQKIGRYAIQDPKAAETPPPAIASYLEEHPRATWRWVRPARGGVFSLVVEPPRPDVYTIFSDSMRKSGTDHWGMIKEFVAGCVPFVDGDESLSALMGRWPGIAIALAKDIAMLGGIAAEAELGE